METFKKLIKSPLTNWDLNTLNQLPSVNLEALCILLGIAKSGTKAKKIERIKAAVKVRLVLDQYRQRHESVEASIADLAHEYTGKELKGLAQEVRCFCSLPNKYAIAASLLNWRSNCIKRGREAYQQAKAENTKKPKQLSLF